MHTHSRAWTPACMLMPLHMHTPCTNSWRWKKKIPNVSTQGMLCTDWTQVTSGQRAWCLPHGISSGSDTASKGSETLAPVMRAPSEVQPDPCNDCGSLFWAKGWGSARLPPHSEIPSTSFLQIGPRLHQVWLATLTYVSALDCWVLSIFTSHWKDFCWRLLQISIEMHKSWRIEIFPHRPLHRPSSAHSASALGSRGLCLLCKASFLAPCLSLNRHSTCPGPSQLGFPESKGPPGDGNNSH